MAKGKTSFVCVERKIGTGQWRWAVTYLGECLGSGVVKSQAACRIEKDRVKKDFLEKHPLKPRDTANSQYSADWRQWRRPQAAAAA